MHGRWNRMPSPSMRKKVARAYEAEGVLTRSEISQLTGVSSLGKPSVHNFNMSTIDMLEVYAEQVWEGKPNLRTLEMLSYYNTVPTLARLLGVTTDEINSALLGNETNPKAN